MKKVFILVLLVLFFAAPMAMAGTYDSEEIVADDGSTVSSLSNKVRLGVNASTTSYAVQTAHSSGSKMYGGSSNETRLRSTTYTENADVDAPTASDSAEFSDWTSL